MNSKLIMRYYTKRLFVLLLCLGIITTVIPMQLAQAQSSEKIVRVGWHESPYFITDENGRYSGYTYDYHQKISAYTGWTYEYVEGSWSDLMQMLKDGKIDMMGNVSYMEDRAKYMLYASLPMGSEAYYLFISPDNQEIQTDDYSSLNGKKIGVAKGSIQNELLRKWLETNGVQAELVELTSTEDESLLLLGSEIDAFVTMDLHGDPEKAVPIWKIGSSDFFFAVSKSRPDLLNELNYAMNRIQDENKFFGQQLHEKYLNDVETELYISEREKEWLADHGTIRVGYQDNYLAFCSSDKTTGQLTGALKDYLDYASDALENTHLDFEAIAYPTAAAAIEALKNGEVDCVFPANLTYYDSEILGVVTTPAMMSTEMDAVVRASDQKEFIHKEHVTVAVNKGNTNYELFLDEHFPDWQTKYYDDTPTCLKAISEGDADCVIISNYRFSNISKMCEKLHLSTVYTGVNMDYYFALRNGDTDLYSILSRITVAVPDANVHTALTYYSTEDVKTSFIDLIKDNLLIVMTLIVVILFVIIFLLRRSDRAEKKAVEEGRMIKELNKKVYVDALTSVRNKGAFANYVQDIQDRVDLGENIEFAIGMLDCDDLKTVNDVYGHDKGDVYLTTASRLICRIFKHSPVFRIGGDEFAVVLQNEDYQNKEALIAEFNKAKDEISASKQKRWEQVYVSLGIAVYDPKIDKSVSDTARRADKIMYENKRAAKKRKR